MSDSHSHNPDASGAAPLLRARALFCERDERVLFSGLDFDLQAGDLMQVARANGCSIGAAAGLYFRLGERLSFATLATGAQNLPRDGQWPTQAALAVQDDDEGTRLVLIEALLAAQRSAEALVAAERHVEAEPMSALGHEFRAVALARLGRADEATSAALRAVELDPAAPAAGRILADGNG